ncbi:MAG TPA: aminotransferase class V-fold PLP-dependent enzyme, partial [Thermoanaerobaculia bacterium]|nr:aminotransferase class V-fold PLP-dependent enzyme [Thermoanaerobaculia bacterium]
VYLGGNSLGPLARGVAERVTHTVAEEWGQELLRAWNGAGWIELPRRAAGKLAPLLGAAPDEVAVTDSTSVDLFKLLLAALRLCPGRGTVLAPEGTFPTDLYVAGGAARLLGGELRIVPLPPPRAGAEAGPSDQRGATAVVGAALRGGPPPRAGAEAGPYDPRAEAGPYDPRAEAGPYDPRAEAGAHDPGTEALVVALAEDVGVLLVSHVDFRSGARLDLPRLARAARGAGALLLADLSHSAGALALELDAWGVDFAVGCGYKFLAGGPGAPAFLYVARRHQEAVASPIPGWLGHAEPFAFAADYRPAGGVDRFLCGTPPILSLAALDATLDAFAGVDMAAAEEKAGRLGDLFLALVAERCAGLGIAPLSPPQAARRGAQVSLRHPRGFAVVQALIARGVLGDFREPDVLRFGLSPLTVRHADVWDAVEALREVLTSGEHQRPQHARRRGVVT